MRRQEFISLLVLLILIIIFSFGAYYLASSFEKNVTSSKISVLEERLKRYADEGYNFVSWKGKDFLIYNTKCKDCVPDLNFKECKKKCAQYLNNSEFTPVDAIVIPEKDYGICYCIFS